MRESILDAAEGMYRNHGYNKVTVSDVAHKLGMSPANVYRFFESKAALREALTDRLTRQVEAVCLCEIRKEGTASQRLSRMILEYHKITIDRYISQANVHEMLAAAMRENWHVVDGHVLRMKEIIRGIISDGIKSGEFNVHDLECATNVVYHGIIAFIDPMSVSRLFVHTNNIEQAKAMGAFIVGALKSGCV
jgi:AcrR family transcriptional regulator